MTTGSTPYATAPHRLIGSEEVTRSRKPVGAERRERHGEQEEQVDEQPGLAEQDRADAPPAAGRTARRAPRADAHVVPGREVSCHQSSALPGAGSSAPPDRVPGAEQAARGDDARRRPAR